MTIFEELAALPKPELDETAIDRIRAGAHALLKRRESSLGHKLSLVWAREVEPAFVVASGLSILVWAISAVIALY
jgi:hypothetical protein